MNDQKEYEVVYKWTNGSLKFVSIEQVHIVDYIPSSLSLPPPPPNNSPITPPNDLSKNQRKIDITQRSKRVPTSTST